MEGLAAGDRFDAYLEQLYAVLGHVDRRAPLRHYVTGLLLPGARKSVEPMAARVDPSRVGARHQSMHHFVANSGWDARGLLRVASDYALAQLERHGPVMAWVVDDTGMPKKGKHSVGVARQYCGATGKRENCQVAVSVSLSSSVLSVPCAYRLYLPTSWAEHPERCRKAGIPEALPFRKKWEIALEQIDQLMAEQLPLAPIVADGGYGAATAFRDALRDRGVPYAVGIPGETSVWPPGQEPLAPAPYSGRGRPAKRLRRDNEHRPCSARQLALKQEPGAWTEVFWREGTRGRMASRFAALRVRPAHRDMDRARPREVEWLLIQWPEAESEPTRYWLSSLPHDIALDELVRLAKIRWRIERDYQELKDELGLDHYEGRGWRGFHHHGALCIAAYCFLAAERARLSPPAPLGFLQTPSVPEGFRPRGAATAS